GAASSGTREQRAGTRDPGEDQEPQERAGERAETDPTPQRRRQPCRGREEHDDERDSGRHELGDRDRRAVEGQELAYPPVGTRASAKQGVRIGSAPGSTRGGRHGAHPPPGRNAGNGTRMSTSSLPAANTTSADRKSTRLNSSHVKISYAVFCLK